VSGYEDAYRSESAAPSLGREAANAETHDATGCELGRPSLRGIFHVWAFLAAIAAGTMLVAVAESGPPRVAAWVYATALAAMFGASAFYHRYPFRSARRRLWARRLDHSAIFVFIAGTYTPFALLALHDPLRIAVLTTVWVGVPIGLVLNFRWIDAPSWLTVLVYMGVGWVGIVTIPQLVAAVGAGGIALLMIGGALYTAGAAIYALRWPDPFPNTFGFHEIFHLLVIAAATIQFVAICLVVV